MPEYYESYGGNVVTSCITRFIYVIAHGRSDNSFQGFSSEFQSHHVPTSYDKLEPKYGTEIAVSVIKHLGFDNGVDLLTCSDIPPGSGLGGSGALAVNLVKLITTLKGENWEKHQIAETAYSVGRNILNWPIGKQDEYATAFGALNYVKFEKDKTTVHPVRLNATSSSELQQNLVLFFLGMSRDSTNILSSQIQRIREKHPDTINSLNTARELAETMYEALSNNDITRFGELLHEGWLAKKKFTNGISNGFIDKVYETARDQGAMGGKVTGAGGGGHLLLYCEPRRQQPLVNKMESFGLKHVEFAFQNEGAKVINLYEFAKV